MHKKNRKKVALGVAIAVGVYSTLVIADESTDTMQLSADDGTDKNVSSKTTTAKANALQEDMQRMAVASGMSNVTTAASANGMHSTVLPLSKMKTLMVRKNADGTFTVGHVSDAESTEKFLSSDFNTTTSGEE